MQIGVNKMSPIVVELIRDKMRKVSIIMKGLVDDGLFYDAFGADADEYLSNIAEDLDNLLYLISKKSST